MAANNSATGISYAKWDHIGDDEEEEHINPTPTVFFFWLRYSLHQ